MNLKLKMLHKDVVFVKVYQFCLLLLRCKEPKKISILDKMLLGVWVRLELIEPI